MLRYIIKPYLFIYLFAALLVSPNVLYAMTCTMCDATYETGEYCRATWGGTSSSCEGEYPGTQFFCFAGDQGWTANIEPPARDKCKVYTEKKYCPGYVDSDCGCNNEWVFCYNCSEGCDGYYLEYNDSTKCNEAKRSTLKVNVEGYFVGTQDCKYVFYCDNNKKYYAPEGATISCSEQTPLGTSTKTFHSCSGCEKCEVGTERFVDAYTGYQQGKKLEFKYVGKWVCGPTGAATGNWRCAPGYYQSGTKTGVDSTKEANIVCTPCPAGTYRSDGGATSLGDCTKCKDGDSTFLESGGVISSHTNANVANTCKECPAGYYQTQSSDGYGKECKKCDIGYYSGSSGQTACTKCPNDAFITDTSILNTSKTQCYINPNIKLSDSLGTIDLKNEIGNATLYYVEP